MQARNILRLQASPAGRYFALASKRSPTPGIVTCQSIAGAYGRCGTSAQSNARLLFQQLLTSTPDLSLVQDTSSVMNQSLESKQRSLQRHSRASSFRTKRNFPTTRLSVAQLKQVASDYSVRAPVSGDCRTPDFLLFARRVSIRHSAQLPSQREPFSRSSTRRLARSTTRPWS